MWSGSHKQNENVHFISYCGWYLMHWLIILWSSEVKRRWRLRTWTWWAYRKYLSRLMGVMEPLGFHAQDPRNTSLPNILSWLKYISEIVKNYLKKQKEQQHISPLLSTLKSTIKRKNCVSRGCCYFVYYVQP